MALPMPPAPVLVPLNPVEALITSVNTNTYFIGFMMILLNLGGRHLVSGLTPEQDKLFQHPWFRRILLFVIIFVATRNVFTAFWMSVAINVILIFLTNETSDLYLFGEPTKPQAQVPTTGLSPEESDIYKKLHEKVAKMNAERDKGSPKIDADKLTNTKDAYLSTYMDSMRIIQGSV
jgi:hypothetical protein